MSSRVISGLAVVREIALVFLERTMYPFCKTLKGINHTRAKDASVIFQRITLLLVSQATSKVLIRECLANLHVECVTQVHKRNRDNFRSLFSDIFDSVAFDMLPHS